MTNAQCKDGVGSGICHHNRQRAQCNGARTASSSRYLTLMTAVGHTSRAKCACGFRGDPDQESV